MTKGGVFQVETVGKKEEVEEEEEEKEEEKERRKKRKNKDKITKGFDSNKQ